MSTTEALRTRLDALQTELYALQAENRRLREAQPEQANLVDVENELAQTREENVRLVQQVSQLTQADRPEGDADGETREAELSRLRRTIATLENEVTEARQGLEKQAGELEEKAEELVRAIARAERAEECVHRLEESLEQTHRDAELDRYRAVAEEMRKWEGREARLNQRIEQLEREAAVVRAGEDVRAAGHTETAGQEQVRTSFPSLRYVIPDR